MTTKTAERYKLEPHFQKVHALVREWAVDVADHEYCGAYAYGEDRVENVENEHRDGFIPYTSGGIEAVLCATLSYADGTGGAGDIIEPYLESARKECEKDWDERNPEHTVAWIYETPDGQLNLLDQQAFEKERESWREKYWDFENEHLSEGGTFFYKIRALYLDPRDSGNESGKPEVLFCVGINTDFEYGRDSIPWLSCYGRPTQQTEWVWEKTVAPEEITPELIKTFAKEAYDALDAGNRKVPDAKAA